MTDDPIRENNEQNTQLPTGYYLKAAIFLRLPPEQFIQAQSIKSRYC